MNSKHQSGGAVGPVAVVTGATSGLGRALALELAGRKFDLILLGRNHRRGSALQKVLARLAPSGRVQFFSCDLASLSDIRNVAARMGHNNQPIDLIINNAGARFDDHQQSPEGFERTFATNHLGHFLLTALLWNSIASAPAARIAAISSSAHRNARPGGDWLWRQKQYDRHQAYACSKLANILFIRELARRAGGHPVVPVAIDPGILMTRFALNNGWIPWLKHWVSHGARRELDSVKATAHWIVESLLNGGQQELRGQLIGRRGLIHPAATDNDEALARELWESSLRWAGLDHPEAGGLGPFSTGKTSSAAGAVNAC